jgi:hypothetical protein
MSSEPIVKGVWGPKIDARTVLATPLKVLCPEVYEGKFGVFHRGAVAPFGRNKGKRRRRERFGPLG